MLTLLDILVFGAWFYGLLSGELCQYIENALK